jgi:hypothetical protein
MSNTAGMTSIRRAVASAHAGLLHHTSTLRVSGDQLEAFANGSGDLRPETIDAICDLLFAGVYRYDAKTDALVNVKTAQPIGLGVMPDRPVAGEAYPDPVAAPSVPSLKPEPCRETQKRVATMLRGAVIGGAGGSSGMLSKSDQPFGRE